jgi:hypothetical protein
MTARLDKLRNEALRIAKGKVKLPRGKKVPVVRESKVQLVKRLEATAQLLFEVDGALNVVAVGDSLMHRAIKNLKDARNHLGVVHGNLKPEAAREATLKASGLDVFF